MKTEPRQIINPLFEITSNYKSIIRFETNGDIYIKENLIENDNDIIEGFREFLKSQRYL